MYKLIVIIAAAMPTILLLRAIFSMCDGDRFAEHPRVARSPA